MGGDQRSNNAQARDQRSKINKRLTLEIKDHERLEARNQRSKIEFAGGRIPRAAAMPELVERTGHRTGLFTIS